MSTGINSLKKIDDFKKSSVNDLKKITRALEIYLETAVEYFPIDTVMHDIIYQKFDKVLSFNYTDTYQYRYDNLNTDLTKYDYVHGKADINNMITSNNMVLGIDEYLKHEDREKNIEFVEYQKYFQRIFKKTGCLHVDWISTIKKLNKTVSVDKHTIHIIGHSLDVSDKDILKELILLDKVKTYIYYHNQNAYNNQIMNLIKVIGSENLTKRVHGKDASIEFVKQAEMSTNKNEQQLIIESL